MDQIDVLAKSLCKVLLDDGLDLKILLREANGAISGMITGFYSFHTDFEKEPWWMVDLGEVVRLKEIKIFNAEAAIARRSAKFALEYSLDNKVWNLLHERTDETPFGGYDGNPFVWRATQPAVASYVRIRLTSENWLHLDQVEVYGDLVRSVPP